MHVISNLWGALAGPAAKARVNYTCSPFGGGPDLQNAVYTRV